MQPCDPSPHLSIDCSAAGQGRAGVGWVQKPFSRFDNTIIQETLHQPKTGWVTRHGITPGRRSEQRGLPCRGGGWHRPGGGAGVLWQVRALVVGGWQVWHCPGLAGQGCRGTWRHTAGPANMRQAPLRTSKPAAGSRRGALLLQEGLQPQQPCGWACNTSAHHPHQTGCQLQSCPASPPRLAPAPPAPGLRTP